jgi:CMP-N,N'-diacetyllegionaminic acid synthase
MLNNLAIITARSGSKGLKDKNIKLLSGKPLIAYSIEAALKSEMFSEVMVSTDSENYADIARQYGASVPFLRSESTSSDIAGSWDVVVEVLDGYRKLGKTFDTVCLLQPTSPLRRAEDIVSGYQQLIEKDADAITSVCEVEHSPLWTMTLDENLSLGEFRRNCPAGGRQKLATYYRLNGALYIRSIGYESEKIAIKDKKEFAYIMPRSRSVDIDTIEDFKYAEFLMSVKQ